MSSITLLRIAARATCKPTNGMRTTTSILPRTTALTFTKSNYFSTTRSRAADEEGHGSHHEETFEEFTARYEKEFEQVQDVFELQRNLNNAFAYDLVPSPSVCVAALQAARRVNDFPTAVRIFEGIKAKVENKGQYEQYLEELKDLREELGVSLKEDLYPDLP